jgi:hypothetical protein
MFHCRPSGMTSRVLPSFLPRFHYVQSHLKSSAEAVLPRATHIFNKFLANGASFAVELDSITRDDIATVLAKEEKARVDDIQRVFEVAFVKVFQMLKFEYMPRFLVVSLCRRKDGRKEGVEGKEGVE